jgi:hypothetical protein
VSDIVCLPDWSASGAIEEAPTRNAGSDPDRVALSDEPSLVDRQKTRSAVNYPVSPGDDSLGIGRTVAE